MQVHSKIAAISAFVATVRAQAACSLTTETHPSLTWYKCASGGTCTAQSGSVVIDANWRWTHEKNGTTNCYTGNEWDASICPDSATCTANCCIDGADYSSTYGVTSSGDALTLKFVTTTSTGTNVGSRLYLLASNSAYETFDLLGNEFTFDVDVSQLPCGLNGALYFVSMDADGGTSEYSSDTAGPAYGTGYCDSQCPRDLKFIGGVANNEDWTPSTNDANSGVGGKGACCSEMDIWEANEYDTAYTPHPCETIGYHVCEDDDCGGTYSTDRYAGDCDPDGCDFNSYRQGNTTFFGPGSSYTIDSTKKVTVVTQFIESGGSLSEIRRYYVQNGKLFANSVSEKSGVTGYNSITEAYCEAQKTAFGDTDSFDAQGGMSQMSKALADPMVLVMSLWDDHYADMLWLDSTYPVGSTGEGAVRGPCSTSSGIPATVESANANAQVIYSNIRFGPINSTYTGTTTGTGGSTTTSTSTGSSSTGAAHYAQCGGIGWTGATTCVSPYTCTVLNAYYSQCL
ncbi:glycoside hydrolase family 7 protein [Xylariales sp. PMI_506]|nr:glycoside hydrolase family 7 protein [Xylariales sp. PMI_506]